MDTIPLAVFWLNLALSIMAGLARLWAAVHVPFLADRRRHQWIGLLALLYSAGYAVVLRGWVPVASWSAFFRGVSLLAWPVVWALPALTDVRSWRKQKQGARDIVAAARDLGVIPVHPPLGSDPAPIVHSRRSRRRGPGA